MQTGPYPSSPLLQDLPVQPCWFLPLSGTQHPLLNCVLIKQALNKYTPGERGLCNTAPSQVIIKPRSWQLSKSGSKERVGRATRSQLHTQEKTGTSGAALWPCEPLLGFGVGGEAMLFVFSKPNQTQKALGSQSRKLSWCGERTSGTPFLPTVKQSSDHGS